MLEKPRLQDEKIITCLHDSYGLSTTAIEFLPLGYDSYAGVYRVDADDGRSYFLKVRQDAVYKPGVGIPRYLKSQGIEQIVAPLPTTSGALWETVDDFALILYPFVEGKNGMDVGLSDSQWIEFGAALNQIHAVRLPSELMGQVRKENFVPNPKWSGIVRRLQAEIPEKEYDNPVEKDLAAFWREKHEEIDKIINRAEALGWLLKNKSMDFVLCHSDIHTANLLITPEGGLFIVDWDQPVFAPREQDLMFVAGGPESGWGIKAKEEELFFRGYGKTEVDSLALAYYRYARIVEDIGDFGELVFLTDGIGDETKQDSVQWFRYMFEPGNVVEAAHRLEHVLSM